MSNLVNWFRTYNGEITWWVIGWLTYAGIDSLARGNFVWALVDAVLIYVNYKLWKERY